MPDQPTEASTKVKAELDKPLPLNDELNKVAEINEKFQKIASPAIKALESAKNSETLTETVKNTLNEFWECAPQFVSNYTGIKDYFKYKFVGGTITKDQCDEMLKELKEAEVNLAKKQVEVGNEAMAELSTQQVKVMKKTFEVIKESCDTVEENKKKLPIIEEKIEEMEKKCAKMEKLMAAYNGQYANDEKQKSVILQNIRSINEQVRTEYIETRRELNSMTLQIDGQIVKLDLLNDQQTDLLIQNASLSILSMLQFFTGKGKPANVVRDVSAGVKNISQNLQAKGFISQAKYDLNLLKEKINELEKRLSAVRLTKEKAEKFLKEHQTQDA